MDNKSSLFRQEAIDSRLNRSLGSVSINIPLSYRIISVVLVVFILIIIIFLFFAKTSEKIVVRGYLDTEHGITSVYSDSRGIITQSMIEEGERITKNSTLFVIARAGQEKTREFLENLNQRRKNLKNEYQIKKKYCQSLSKLYKKHYVSLTLLQNTKAELLEIRNRIKSVDLELIQFKQNQYQLIKSPINGVVTNILYKEGQSIDPSKALLQILPDNAKLIARLYIPAQNIGFLKKGDSVAIKYDAYPSQRFGIYKALVKEINLTVLTDDKEDKPINVGQPYYKIKAELDKYYVNVYGEKTNLSHGMTLTAVFSGDKRKMWQWILDPIFSYYGKVS